MSFGVALRRAVAGPLHDGVDFLLRQRAVVLVVLDADARVDVPGRHVARRHAIANRTRPRTRLFVGLQRHRRDRIRPVARLALVLENRRDVLGERRYGSGLSRERCRQSQEASTRPPPRLKIRPTIRLAIFPLRKLPVTETYCGWGVYLARKGLSLLKPLMATITYANVATAVYRPRSPLYFRLVSGGLSSSGSRFPARPAAPDGRAPACVFRPP